MRQPFEKSRQILGSTAAPGADVRARDSPLVRRLTFVVEDGRSEHAAWPTALYGCSACTNCGGDRDRG